MSQLRGLNHAQHVGIFNPDAAKPVTLIGAGCVGSLVAMQLGKIGVREIEVYDDDTVASHNLPSSAYGLSDIGMVKVEALARRLKDECDVDLVARPRRWTHAERLRETIVMCVDSMDARQVVWEACRKDPLADILIDTRVGAEFICVYAIDLTDRDAVEEYAHAVSYGTKEAAMTTCGLHGIAHVNGLAASVAVGLLTARWMRGEIPKRRFEFTMHEAREIQP